MSWHTQLGHCPIVATVFPVTRCARAVLALDRNPVLGPIPSMDYFCVRTWMVLIVLIGWLIYDICKTDKNDGLKKRR